jgi:hypothetical protein
VQVREAHGMTIFGELAAPESVLEGQITVA